MIRPQCCLTRIGSSGEHITVKVLRHFMLLLILPHRMVQCEAAIGRTPLVALFCITYIQIMEQNPPEYSKIHYVLYPWY